MKFNQKTELTIQNKKWSSDTIDIDFLVKFEDSKEPNVHEVSLWNPSDDTIKSIKKGQQIILSAGYGVDIGTLVAGAINGFEVNSYDVDRELKLYVTDGLDTLKQTIKRSFQSITNKAIISLIAPNAKFDAKVITYPNFVANGSVKSIMDRLAKDAGAKYYSKNEKLYFVNSNFSERTGFLLNADSGLIGIPERVEIDEKDGFKIKCLLEHRINVGSLIRVQSRTVNGDFRVVKGQHASDFITEIEVLP